MKKSHDLATYLQHWKDHFVPDVEGQQLETHLSDMALESLANGAADEEQLQHLSSCPQCLERWADIVGERQSSPVFALPLAYGGEEDEDVVGQCLTRTLTSECGRFTLTLQGQDARLQVHEPSLEGHHLQVRSKDGLCFMDDVVDGGVLKSRVEDVTLLDLTLWTVLGVDDAS